MELETRIKELKKRKLKGISIILLGALVYALLYVIVLYNGLNSVALIVGVVLGFALSISGALILRRANLVLSSYAYDDHVPLRPSPRPKPQQKDLREDGSGKCPKCGRAYYRKGDYCKWCGAMFDKTGHVIPGHTFIAPDYFRHPWDVNNIVPYNTLDESLNHVFYSYLHQSLTDCKVEAKVYPRQLFPDAPEYAMPLNFLITKGDKRLAVFLVHKDKTKRYSLLESMMLCGENGIEAIRFYIEYENEESYVVERIRKALA